MTSTMKGRWMTKQYMVLFTAACTIFVVYCIMHLPSSRVNINLQVVMHLSSTTEDVKTNYIIESNRIPSLKYLRISMDEIQSNVLHKNLRIAFKIVSENLQRELLEDKGMGCDIPKTDPFAKEIVKFNKNVPKITCDHKIANWIQCYLSKCKVDPKVFSLVTDLECTYRDLILKDDFLIQFGPKQLYKGNHEYKFNVSDHVAICCYAKEKNNSNDSLKLKWKGYEAGFRPVIPKKSPTGREKTYNVLLFAFDSTSKNGFIRKMPKSYRFLKEELKSVIYNGYNIVGEGTPAALFPILTGKTELELPECRINYKTATRLDSMPFIFYKLKDDGYRTAYFEDLPWIGTFQFRFNGFTHQPADHYLRAFLQASYQHYNRSLGTELNSYFCLPNTPRFKLMMNLTDQFFQLDGKKFAFTFISDITHEDFNYISSADEDFVDFMRGLIKQGILNDTLIIVMGDHGPRYENIRSTLQGKLEERLPLMAVRLPDSLIAKRPDAQKALEQNANVLTTPHDIHATILDVLDMTEHWNDFKVKGADLTRGLTLLKPIPKTRSCSEAGIEPHWCVCLKWKELESTNPLFTRVAHVLVAKINHMTKFVENLCARRNLTSILWVMHKQNNEYLRSFKQARDPDGFVPSYYGSAYTDRQTYQVKIEVSPGNGTYEASVTHLLKSDKLIISSRDISRTNRYNDEPNCISRIYPHLNPYCYCIT